jgi:hypothetical protein
LGRDKGTQRAFSDQHCGENLSRSPERPESRVKCSFFAYGCLRIGENQPAQKLALEQTHIGERIAFSAKNRANNPVHWLLAQSFSYLGPPLARFAAVAAAGGFQNKKSPGISSALSLPFSSTTRPVSALNAIVALLPC